MRIGILQTDNVSPNLQTIHGDYPAMFQKLFDSVRSDLSYTVYDVRSALPQDIDCDAYVITGSKFSVYDDLPWIGALADFIAQVLAAKRKVIGVCFGHQLIAHFFGGEVAPASVGWAVGVHRSDVVAQVPGMDSGTESVSMLSSHKDQVIKLPDGAQIYLSNEFCPIGGYTLGDQVITVQGHPEFSKGYAQDLMNTRQESIGGAVIAAAVESLSESTQDETVARWLLNFVESTGG